jgi:DNA polymerase-1
MSAKEAEASRDRYFKLYPALQKYHDSFKSKSTLTCRTAEPFKRIRKWAEYAGVPQLANFPVQGGSADMQKLAMAMAYERLYAAGYSPLQSNDIKLVMTIHDEIVIEVVESKGEFAKELLEKCMVEAGQFVLKHVPVEAEGKLMDNLSEKD